MNLRIVARLVGLLVLCGQTGCWSLPLLGSVRDVGALRVYSDSAASSTFYYSPGKLSIALDSKGAPELSFLQMRYLGTSASGDKGDFRTRSILSFRVKMAVPSAAELAAAKAKLRAEARTTPILKPMPIRKVEATLNYTPLVDAPSEAKPEEVPSNEPVPVGSGALESSGPATPGGSYWSERVFTVTPDDATSQALWDTMKKGNVILSLSYAFYSDGMPPGEEKPVVETNIEIPSDQAAAQPQEHKPDPHVVMADTLVVTIDAARYPERFKQIDINESVPANYAALSVYCYDFSNDLRPDLYEKVVEIRAKSVTGVPLTVQAAFSKSSPDICSATVRFGFAVSLKDPYTYRIREISASGEEKVRPWQPGKPWSQMLDVTTPPEEQPMKPDNADSGEEP